MSEKTPDSKPAGKARAEPAAERTTKPAKPKLAKEIGGPKGLEPTRYGDWERKGIVSDF